MSSSQQKRNRELALEVSRLNDVIIGLRAEMAARSCCTKKCFIEIDADTIELLSAAEHERWSKWYLHQRDHSTPVNVQRWDTQASMEYAELTEEVKELDRVEVRELLKAVLHPKR